MLSTGRQHRFVAEYQVDLTATQAAIATQQARRSVETRALLYF